MERLTIPDERIDAHTTRRTFIDASTVREDAMKFYWRLKAYEDTGLTPDEIKAAADRRHNCKIDCLLDQYNRLSDEIAALRAQLEQPDEPLTGPLKIGDSVHGMKIIGLDALAGTITLSGWKPFCRKPEQEVNHDE